MMDPDLFVIEAGEHTLNVAAKPRNQKKVFWIGAVVIAVTLSGPVQFALGAAESVRRRGELSGAEWTFVGLCGVPVLLAIAAFVLIILRMHRLRAITIAEGQVTLFTPDLPISVHKFDRMNLKEGEVFRNARGSFDLRIHRRNGVTVPVFLGYDWQHLVPVAQAVNALVIEDRRYGFEVISVAQIAPPDALRL